MNQENAAGVGRLLCGFVAVVGMKNKSYVCALGHVCVCAYERRVKK